MPCLRWWFIGCGDNDLSWSDMNILSRIIPLCAIRMYSDMLWYWVNKTNLPLISTVHESARGYGQKVLSFQNCDVVWISLMILLSPCICCINHVSWLIINLECNMSKVVRLRVTPYLLLCGREYVWWGEIRLDGIKWREVGAWNACACLLLCKMVLMSLWNGLYWDMIWTISVCDTGFKGLWNSFYRLVK